MQTNDRRAHVAWCNGIPSSVKMDDFFRSLSNLGYSESNTSLCADLPPQQERNSCKLYNEEEVRQLLHCGCVKFCYIYVCVCSS